MKELKFIFVSNMIWNLYNFRLPLMKYFINKGIKVIAIAPFDSFVQKLKKENIECIDLNIQRKGLNPINDLILLFKLYRIYKRMKPDIVFHYTVKPNIYGTIAAYMANIKSINTVSGLGYIFVRKSLLQFIVKFLYRIAFNLSSKVIFQNNADYELFIKNKLVSLKRATVVNGSGIDTNFYSPANCKCQKRYSKFTFALISRLLWDKGVAEFVNAASVIKQRYLDTQFYLVGPIDKGNPATITMDNIKVWVKNKIIKYKEFISDVRKFICKVDVIVLPSYREGLPRILLEAASMEKPIITTDVPGCKEVVENDKTGFVVPPGDYLSLAKAMEKMIKISSSKREIMGKAARRKVKKEFDIEIVIKKYINIVKEILEYDIDNNS